MHDFFQIVSTNVKGLKAGFLTFQLDGWVSSRNRMPDYSLIGPDNKSSLRYGEEETNCLKYLDYVVGETPVEIVDKDYECGKVCLI